MSLPRAAAMVAVFGLMVPDGGTHGGSDPWVYWVQPAVRIVAGLAIAAGLLAIAWRCLRPREDWRESALDFEPTVPPLPRPPRPPRRPAGCGRRGRIGRHRWITPLF